MTQTTVSDDQVSIQPKDGDVYRFVYSRESWDRAKTRMGGGDLNWAFDGQLVFRDGWLCDTYWGLDWRGDTGRRFRVAEAVASGELTFICNLNDVEKIRDYEYELYAEADAFNLSHQHGCYKHFVKRKGARKDPEQMRRVLDKKVADARHAVDSAVRQLEYSVARRVELLPRIEAGEEVTP